MKTRGFLLAAALAAMVFTLSCSSDDEGGGGGSSCNADFGAVTIGTQVWAAKNLNCDAGVSTCYGNNPANCDKYGRLYNRETSLTICPKGWHLPSEAEWNVLINYAGGSTAAGTKLKATNGWNDYEGESGNGTDDYGFSALPGGQCPYSTGAACYGVGTQALWWTATKGGTLDGSDARAMFSSNTGVVGSGVSIYFYSVRCVKN